MNAILFLLPIIAAVLVAVLRFTELGKKRDVVPGEIKETITLKIFVLNGLLVLIVATAEYIIQDRTLTPLPFTLGLIVAIASFVLRRAAINGLGRFWSTQIEMRSNHEMVTSGPFQWVRHPTYLSMYLELLAILLLLNSYVGALLIVFILTPALLYRIRLEEQALIEKFGDSYRDYINSTPMLIPYRIPKSLDRAQS